MQEKGWNKTYPIEGNESSLRKKNTHRKDVGISGYKWDTGELQIPQAWCYWSVWYQSKHLQIWITSLFRPRTSQPWHLRKCLCYISNPPANCINIKWINHGSKGHYLKDLHKLNKPPLLWKQPRPYMVGAFSVLAPEQQGWECCDFTSAPETEMAQEWFRVTIKELFPS